MSLDRTIRDRDYIKRRRALEIYFDRTAVDGWKKLVTDAPVSRIRATVRAGRDAMRAHIGACLPDDLSGWRILDAGCGSGPLSLDLARRGADVTGIDLSPEMVRFAQDRAASEGAGLGRVTFYAGDMLSPDFGRFDAVVAMDSVIHYDRPHALAALASLAERTDQRMVFTIAPRTPALSVMHFAGKLFPRGDRSPAIVPHGAPSFRKAMLAQPAFAGWQAGSEHRVSTGFYISHAMEVVKP